MKLAESIEYWGRTHRGDMSRDELQELATTWRTIKRSSFAELDFRTMTKDDATAIMALFEPEQRAHVSRTLNQVRKWSLAVPVLGGSPDVVNPIEANQVDGDDPSGTVPVVPIQGDRIDGPGAATVRMQRPGSPDRGLQAGLQGSGPVEGWEPPTARLAPTAPVPNQTMLIGAGAAVLVALLIWLVFIRGGDDTQSVETGDVATQDADAAGTTSGVAAADTAGAAVTDTTGGESEDFCQVARELEASDPFSEAALNSFGPARFDQALAVYARMSAIAPAEIKADLDLSALQLTQTRDLAAQFDFNLANPELGTALAQLDTSAFDQATGRLDSYFLVICGIGADDPAG